MNYELMELLTRQKQQERLQEAGLAQALKRSRAAIPRRVQPADWLRQARAFFQDWAPTRQRTGA